MHVGEGFLQVYINKAAVFTITIFLMLYLSSDEHVLHNEMRSRAVWNMDCLKW